MSYEPATKLIVSLRLFARMLCQNRVEADNLVRETLEASVKYPREINLSGVLVSLLSIMRDLHFEQTVTNHSRSLEPDNFLDCSCQSHVDCSCQARSAQMTSDGEHRLEAAIRTLPLHLREAVVLVMVLNQSVDHAALVIGCDEEIVSKRVKRAQNILYRKLR